MYATVIPAVFICHSMFIFLYLSHDAVRTSKLITEVINEYYHTYCLINEYFLIRASVDVRHTSKHKKEHK